MLRKILCFLGIHKEEVEEIIIQPMYTSEWLPEGMTMQARKALMYKCASCGNEDIVG